MANSVEETATAIQEAFQGRFGQAGEQLVLEERLTGPEVSVFALCDGENMVLLPPAQDHKRLLEGIKDRTRGMGLMHRPLLDQAQLEQVRERILEPTLAALRKRGILIEGDLCGSDADARWAPGHRIQLPLWRS